MGVRSYANDYDVSYAIAEYRIHIQMEIGNVGSELVKDKEHFGGLYIEHKPTYSVNVLYKNLDNTQKLDSLIADKSWREFVKIHPVKFSLEELRLAQKEAIDIVSKLDIRFSSSIDVKNNRADIQVLDKELLEHKLFENAVKLPNEVLITIVRGFAEID